MKYQTILKLFFLAILFIVTSCGGIIKSYIRKDDSNVPADFGKEKSIVLIVKWKKAYNKEVESDFKKYYKGDYLMVSNEDLKTLYADVSKYRYSFAPSLLVISTQNTMTGMSQGSSGSLSCQLTDRAANHVYDTNVSSGLSWHTVARTYIQKIEKIRAKNAGQ